MIGADRLLSRAYGRELSLPTEDSNGALQGRALRWLLAFVCVLALLLGSFFIVAEEAEAKGQGRGPADKTVHEQGNARPAAQPAGHPQPGSRSSQRPSDRQHASRPAGQKANRTEPARGGRAPYQTASAPDRRGSSGAHRPSARDPEHRAPANGEPVRHESAHRQPAAQEPVRHGAADPPGRAKNHEVATPSGRGTEHHKTAEPVNRKPAEPPGQVKHREAGKPIGQEAHQKPAEPVGHRAAGPPGWTEHHEATKPAGRKMGHHETAETASHKPAEPPGQAKHHGAEKSPGQPEHHETAKPAEPPGQAKRHEAPAPPGQVSHEESPQLEKHRVAGPAEQEGIGSVESTEPAEGRAGDRSDLGLSRHGEAELSGRTDPLRPAADERASQRVVPSVERSSQPPHSVVPVGGTGSRSETATSAIQQALAKRASFAFEPLWGTVGSLLGVLVRTTSDILEPIANLLAGVRPAGDFGGRGPPTEAPPLSLPPLPSGTGLLASNSLSGAGSSGGGFGPLLAVLTLLMIAVARRGRFWVHYELPKPGLVPRLMQRPG